MIPILDHSARAAQSLPQILRQPRIQALAAALAGEAQEAEDVVLAVEEARRPEEASGRFLDDWGIFHGVPRGDLDDDDFRALIFATMAAGFSDTTADGVLRLTSRVIDIADGAEGPTQVRYRPAHPAGYALEFDHEEPLSDRLATVLPDLLVRATAAGVEVASVVEGTWPLFATGFADDTSNAPRPEIEGLADDPDEGGPGGGKLARDLQP